MNRHVAPDLIDRVDALLTAVEADLGVHDSSPPDGYVIWLFSRVRSNFLASKVLISHRLIDEAMHLARSLMTDALRLMKLERVATARSAYVLGWVDHSYREQENLMREDGRIGLEPSPDEVLAHIEEQRQTLVRYQIRHAVGQLRRFPSERQLAFEFGLEREYWDFEYLNNVVHGSPLTAPHRLQSRHDGVLLVTTFADDPAWVTSAVLTTSQWALLALRSFRTMFAPDDSTAQQIADLLEEISVAAGP